MRRVALVLALLAAGVPSAEAQPGGDWTVKRDPFDRSLIARYKAILARTPHDRMALSALVSLYKRHRTLDLLVKEYDDELAKQDTTANQIVLARLARHRGDQARASELLTRATAAAPSDARAWQALGELHVISDPTRARTAFEQAAATTKSATDKRTALTALLSLAVAGKDPALVDSTSAKLIELSPKDGALWQQRADALAQLGRNDLALESYAKAEKLLGSDPERKLDTIAARALALARSGKTDEAITEYDRAIAASPPGYYLRKELVLRIVELHRKQFPLPHAIAKLEQRWPIDKRTHFEWSTLAKLYEEAQDKPGMVEALRRATQADPRDTQTQWKLIQHYDRTRRADLALKQLKLAAAASPTDVSMQVELAQRIREARPRDAVAMLEKLAKATPRDAEAHRAIGEVYIRWGDQTRAIRELTLAAKLDPTDESTLTLLGDALLEAGRLDEALATWEKIGKGGKPEELMRLGNILAEHDMWEEAVTAYTKAMFNGGTQPTLWSARARALNELGQWSSALADGEHAVKLLGAVPYDAGFDVRLQLARTVQHMFGGLDTELAPADATPEILLRWQRAFAAKQPDLQAGYMLAVFHSRAPNAEHAAVLEKLRKLVPTDATLADELIRSYRVQAKWEVAESTARAVAKHDPKRAGDMDKALAEIARDRERANRPTWSDDLDDDTAFLTDQSLDPEDIEHEESHLRDVFATADDPVDPRRPPRVPLVVGARFAMGMPLAGAATRTTLVTSYHAVPLTERFDFVVRTGWAQHATEMRLAHAATLGLGLGTHRMVTRDIAIGVSTSERVELRVDKLAPFERIGLSADLGVDVTHRKLPLTVGLRIEQPLFDPARGSTVFVDVTAGFRCLKLSGGSGACR